MKVAIITTITTNYGTLLHPSPLNKEHSFCFTDNKEIIESFPQNNSWTIIEYKKELINFFLENEKLKTDCIDFNFGFLSKIAKTIQIQEYINIDKYDYIIYADHKFLFTDNSINILLNMIDDSALLLQKQLKYFEYNNNEWKNRIWNHILKYRDQNYLNNIIKNNGKIKNEALFEYLEGQFFPRYRNHKFIKYNENYIKENDKKYGSEGDCVWTGNIIYNMKHPKTKKIAKIFMEEIIKSRTPNCQISFFYILKRFRKYIKLIENPDLNRAIIGRKHSFVFNKFII